MFPKKFDPLTGTHCWYCDREFGKAKRKFPKKSGQDEFITKTKDHIVSKSKGGPNSRGNLVACCNECNLFKMNKNAKQFAKYLSRVSKLTDFSHHLRPFFPIMIKRAWKAYNKTSKIHLNVEKQNKI